MSFNIMAGMLVVPLSGVIPVTPTGGVQYHLILTDGVAELMVTVWD